MELSQHTTLTNVRYFDGATLTSPCTILIDGSLISEIRSSTIVGSESASPSGKPSRIIDCTGKTLLPGLIDCHVHLSNLDDLHALSSHGVTTALDMACWPVSRLEALRSQSVPGICSFQSAGLPATVKGSVHSCVLPFSADDLVQDVQDAKIFVAKRKKEGSDYIKLIADVPGPSQEILTALTAEAHAAGLKVIAHAAASKPFVMALDAGVDIVTHAPRDLPVSEESAQRMVERKVISVPTLTMMKGLSQPPPLSVLLGVLTKPRAIVAIAKARRASPAPVSFESAVESVRIMHRAGVTVLMGTDANSEKGSPCNILHGASMHDEFVLLMEAGMTNVEVLRAATCEAAKAFGLDDRGVIEAGKRADLVLVEGNPLEDITATRNIVNIWCQGIEVKPKS